MKLANKEFPFWAWNPKKRDTYDLIRFVEKKGYWNDYYYDYLLHIHSYYTMSPGVYGGKLRHSAKYSKNTVSGFRDVTTLPITGKKILLDHIFNLKGD